MPDRVQLSPYDHVETLKECAVDRPVIQLQPGVDFLELSDAYLDTFKNRILYVSHVISHGYLELNDFGLLAAL